MEPKFSDTPKRFNLSSEDFAQARIHAVKGTMEEMKERFPEVLAASLFGSLVKGKVTEESDTDIVVFVDPELIHQDDSQNPKTEYYRYDFHSLEQGARVESAYHYLKLRKDIEEKYRTAFTAMFKARSSDLDEVDVIFSPMNVPIVTKMINDIIASYKLHPNGVPEEKIFLMYSEKREKDSIVDESVRLEPNQELYTLFHLEAGGNLQPYRQAIIEMLIAAGDVGEKIWSKLIATTEEWEEKLQSPNQLPSNHRFPRTLKEAQALYIKR
jgi:hypothetical protein